MTSRVRMGIAAAHGSGTELIEYAGVEGDMNGAIATEEATRREGNDGTPK